DFVFRNLVAGEYPRHEGADVVFIGLGKLGPAQGRDLGVGHVLRRFPPRVKGNLCYLVPLAVGSAVVQGLNHDVPRDRVRGPCLLDFVLGSSKLLNELWLRHVRRQGRLTSAIAFDAVRLGRQRSRSEMNPDDGAYDQQSHSPDAVHQSRHLFMPSVVRMNHTLGLTIAATRIHRWLGSSSSIRYANDCVLQEVSSINS